MVDTEKGASGTVVAENDPEAIIREARAIRRAKSSTQPKTQQSTAATLHPEPEHTEYKIAIGVVEARSDCKRARSNDEAPLVNVEDEEHQQKDSGGKADLETEITTPTPTDGHINNARHAQSVLQGFDVETDFGISTTYISTVAHTTLNPHRLPAPRNPFTPRLAQMQNSYTAILVRTGSAPNSSTKKRIAQTEPEGGQPKLYKKPRVDDPDQMDTDAGNDAQMEAWTGTYPLPSLPDFWTALIHPSDVTERRSEALKPLPANSGQRPRAKLKLSFKKAPSPAKISNEHPDSKQLDLAEVVPRTASPQSQSMLKGFSLLQDFVNNQNAVEQAQMDSAEGDLMKSADCAIVDLYHGATPEQDVDTDNLPGQASGPHHTALQGHVELNDVAIDEHSGFKSPDWDDNFRIEDFDLQGCTDAEELTAQDGEIEYDERDFDYEIPRDTGPMPVSEDPERTTTSYAMTRSYVSSPVQRRVSGCIPVSSIL